MTTDETLSGIQDDAVGRGTLSDLLAVPGYRSLCVSSWLWHTTRWGGLFSTSYLLTQIANSPLLNQVAGALIFAPMLVGGFFAGIVSDRFDRRRLLLATQLTLIPISLLMFVLVQSGHVRVWMTFPFMFALGIGGLLNMTAQRPLIYETVGDGLASRALTIETTAQAAAGVVGTLVGGALIQGIGTGASFAGMAILLCLSASLLRVVPSPQAARAGSTPPVSVASQVRASAELVRRSRLLVAMLGVTVIQNVFYFSFTPMVPVVAKQFGASAVVAGALSAAAGCGQVAAGALLSSRHIKRRGLVFAGGAGIALLSLSVFASAPLLGIAFAALVVSGVGQAGFASMQSLLAIESASVFERGAALGVLSTAIGSLPLGMVVIGFGAQAFGPRPALLISAVTGFLALAGLMARSPELLAPTAGSPIVNGTCPAEQDKAI
jgi:MFS family permease